MGCFSGYLLLLPGCEVSSPPAAVIKEETVDLSSQVHVFQKVLEAVECGRRVAKRSGEARGALPSAAAGLPVQPARPTCRSAAPRCSSDSARSLLPRSSRSARNGSCCQGMFETVGMSRASAAGVSLELHACNLTFCR